MLATKEICQIFRNLEIKNTLYSVETLLDPEKEIGIINYTPDYQRQYVWDSHKASFFIETILLGSELPPFVIFKNNLDNEIIDGRQRYETLLRFYNNQFYLHAKGLLVLKKFHGCYYRDLPPEIQDVFKDTLIRIMNIKINDFLNTDEDTADMVKKGIFRRVNIGITTLKEVELERAKYIDNDIIQYFKTQLRSNNKEFLNVLALFLPAYEQKNINNPDLIERVLKKIRFLLVLSQIKINYYAKSSHKYQLIDSFFASLNINSDSIINLYRNFINKVNTINIIKMHLDTHKINHNFYLFEALFWGLCILEIEGINHDKYDNSIFLDVFLKFAKENASCFFEKPNHYSGNIIIRYEKLARLLENHFEIDLKNHFDVTQEFKLYVKSLVNKDPKQILTKELNLYRLYKTEPSPLPILEIIKMMKTESFLIRPSYQRKECMDKTKASRLIESVLLDFKIPPIFVYVRNNGVREVIDGQQRLLAFLGFIGSEYINEFGEKTKSLKHNFRLKNLEILKDLNNNNYNNLNLEQKQKIRNAIIPFVQINEGQNKMFNPVDLFIRLNSKPYPVKEHSFEMWNTIMPKSMSKFIKDTVYQNQNWFYLRSEAGNTRMLNEEFYTYILYLENQKKKPTDINYDILTFFKKEGYMNLGLKKKSLITDFIYKCIKNDTQVNIKMQEDLQNFLKKLTLLLEKEDNSSTDTLKKELDKLLLNDMPNTRNTKILLLLWYLISPIKISTIKNNRNEIKKHIRKIMKYFKATNKELHKHIDIKDNFEKEKELYWRKFMGLENKRTIKNNLRDSTKSTQKEYDSTNMSIVVQQNKNAKIKIYSNYSKTAK